MTEDKMVGWHHLLNEHEFEQTLGDGEGQGSLESCRPWGHIELDMTERLNNYDCVAIKMFFLPTVSHFTFHNLLYSITFFITALVLSSSLLLIACCC